MTNYEQFFSQAALKSKGSAIRKMGVMAVRVPDMISFAPGYPDPGGTPGPRSGRLPRGCAAGARFRSPSARPSRCERR